MSTPLKRIFINEAGLPFIGETPLTEDMGHECLSKLYSDEFHILWTKLQGQKAIVTAFDEAFMVQQVSLLSQQEQLLLTMPYGFQTKASLEKLFLDPWDRICGLSEAKIPFMLSKPAQMMFFDLLEGFEDDSIRLWGKTYPTPLWRDFNSSKEFWEECYKSNDTPWDQNQAHNYLTSQFHRMKLLKSKILILGSGYGHDAAYLAQKGHLVTAIERDSRAFEKALKLYSHIPGLTLLQQDVFNAPIETESFDLIFEHTFFCALGHEDKKQLTRLWKQALRPQGLLLGVFFLSHSLQGPPFSTNQRELHARLEPEMRRLYIYPWENSNEPRKFKEHIVCFQKKSGGK